MWQDDEGKPLGNFTGLRNYLQKKNKRMAFATKTSTALGICISRGTDCTVANKGDNYEICVKNTNGTECVSCGNLAQPSDKQTCSVQRTAKPGQKPYLGPAGLLADE